MPCADDVTLHALATDPYPVLARLRARSPVTWVPALDGWLVTTHAAVSQVLDDPQTYTVDDPRFTTAAVVGASMLSLDGVEHARHRRPFAAGFRPALVDGVYAPRTQALAVALLDRLRPDGAAELRTAFAGPLAADVITDLLGLADVDAATVLGWYSAIVGSVSALSRGEPATDDGAAAAAELAARVRAAVAGPSSTTRPDGMLAAAARPPSGLTPDEVAANAAVLMFGGIETVEGMIANALLHVLSAPEPAALRADAGRLANSVEESLRLEPAAARVDRYATRDTVLAGVPVSAGDLVVASLGAAGRDPAVFADPDRFDPGRPGIRRHLAFARGLHVCVASGLARRQAVIALDAVLALPGVRLDPAASTAPAGLVFRKPERVVVRWDVPPVTAAPVRPEPARR